MSNESSAPMFDDLFDFAKKRTLKQSVGFFLFYGGIAFTVVTVLEIVA